MLVILLSILIRLAAFAWSLVVLRRLHDWRIGFLSAMLALMTARQALTLRSALAVDAPTRTGWNELPGLAVSVLAFLAVIGIERMVLGMRRAHRELSERDAQLRQAQKMEIVGQLAGGIAHDFNNLLTAILGHADLLEDSLEDGTAREDAREIRSAAECATRLTAQLLAFSRRQVVQPQVLDLNTVVRRTERILRRLIGEDVELVLDLAPDAGLVLLDPSQLEQIVMNLALNARDAMPEGGLLTLRTRAGDDEITLEVQDTGVGMPEEVRARAFEPFFTTKSTGQGTGLGLTTVYGIVEGAGGVVDLASHGGTTVTVRLPLAQGEARGIPQPGSRVLEGVSGVTVLVAEDSESVRELVRRVLEESGYEVVVTRNGVDALAVLKEREVDLVLTDVVMPGIHGGALAKEAERVQPGVRVLFMSGYPHGSASRFTSFEPEWPMLQKPFRAEELIGAVTDCLAK